MLRGRLARFLGFISCACCGVLCVIGEGRINAHRRLFLLRLPRLAVASHLSFGHWFDSLNWNRALRFCHGAWLVTSPPSWGFPLRYRNPALVSGIIFGASDDNAVAKRRHVMGYFCGAALDAFW